MTALALPGKCGGFGDSGFSSDNRCLPVVSARRVPAAPPDRSDANATLPTPTPHSRKKCRRVTDWPTARGSFLKSDRFILFVLPSPALAFGDGFIQVHQHSSNERPGS